MERELYSSYFDIPKERIRLRLWSIGTPEVEPALPLQNGRYVSSIGGNGRDYRSLVEAARLLPNIQFVLVVRPQSLSGLDVPANAKALVNLPLGEAMNVMKHSEFTVLPLSGVRVPCGHVTLVCAMHLEKTVIATRSAGISDYVFPGYNGVLCDPLSPESLASEIERLWEDHSEVARLSGNNRAFGREHCSETKMRTDLATVLAELQIPLRAQTPEASAAY